MVYTLMCWNSWNYFRVNTPKEKHSNAEVHTKPWNHDNDDAFETFLGVFSFFVTLAMLFCLRVRSDVGKSEYNKWSYFGDHISTQFGPIRSGQTIIKMPRITCASWLNYNLLMRISNPTINNHSHVIGCKIGHYELSHSKQLCKHVSKQQNNDNGSTASLFRSIRVCNELLVHVTCSHTNKSIILHSN